MTTESTLPLGQREVDHNTTFTEDEINLIEDHHLTIEQVRHHLEQVGTKSLETAIGSLVGATARGATDEAEPAEPVEEVGGAATETAEEATAGEPAAEPEAAPAADAPAEVSMEQAPDTTPNE